MHTRPTVNFQQQKERILSLIQSRGPCLPVQIARGINVTTIFAGAFLSDLYSEKKIKISNMKVGSSPLYYMVGQESLLENFISHLQQREKEAFLLLKQESVLEDDSQTPIIRVALRAIKDFALPVNIRINNESKLFWKFHSLQDLEAKNLIETKVYPQDTFVKPVKKELPALVLPPSVKQELKNESLMPEQKIEKSPVVEKPIEHKVIKKSEKSEKKHEQIKQEFMKEEIKEELIKEESKKAKEAKPKKQKEMKESPFSSKVKSYLLARDIEILQVLLEKNKEFTAKIRIDMPLGKQEFFLVAKDKKSVNDNDLTIALQNAQTARMPALFLSTGDLHKKAKDYIKDWNNLIKFERIKG